MHAVDRKDLRAPALVIDLELISRTSDAEVDVAGYQGLWCLSRTAGIPREITFWDVASDITVSLADMRKLLADSAIAAAPPASAPAAQPVPAGTGEFSMTIVICTRNRPDGLRSALASLREQDDQDFRVLVVDNGPDSPGAAEVVREFGIPGWEYVAEPRRGLSRARNTGLAGVRTALVGWLDDDETADPAWVRMLKEGFADESAPAAVCGLMLPAELEHEAQVRFEQYGGFNKGRGLAPEVLRAGTPTVVSPLYPLPTFGPGGNMAFRTDLLRGVGGFDPFLGAGTRTHGGEEMRAFSALLSAGHAVLHWPTAIAWHTHRRDMSALTRQFYGYSAGLPAFYMSTLRARPGAIAEILRLVPHVLRDLRGGSDNQRTGHLPDDFPPELLSAGRRGLLLGGPMYVYEALAAVAGAVARRGAGRAAGA